MSDIGESDHGEPRVISVYDGRHHLGDVCIGRSIRAVIDGIEIGTYEKIEDARRALVQAARAAEAQT